MNEIEHTLQVAVDSAHRAATARPMSDHVRVNHGWDSPFRDLRIGAGPKPLPALHRPSGSRRCGLRATEHDDPGLNAVLAFQPGVLGSPGYFAAHGKPSTPKDLLDHDCIGYRFPSAKTVYRWQFQEKGREFSVDAAGTLVVNDHLSMIALARSGIGLAYTADLVAAREISAGTLQPVLRPYLPTTQGLHLYFPRRSQTQPKLRAFVDFLTKNRE